MSKKTTVLVTGVFDLLHGEHINFLKAAKKAGDYLLVGIESDVRVRKIKGGGRPIWDQQRRKKEIEKTKIADRVFILPENFDTQEKHEELVGRIKPDILAVSSHTQHLQSKKKIMEKFAGELKVVYEFVPGVSTSKKIVGQSDLD